MRARLRDQLGVSMLLDGLIAALAITAVAAAILFQAVLDSLVGVGGLLQVATNLAYRSATCCCSGRLRASWP